MSPLRGSSGKTLSTGEQVSKQSPRPDVYDKSSGHTGFCSKYCYHYKKIRNQTLDEVKRLMEYCNRECENYEEWIQVFTSKFKEMREGKK